MDDFAASPGRKPVKGLLLMILILSPGILGAVHALRLASASWMTAAFGKDPVVTRLRGDAEPLEPRDIPERYGRAAGIAGLDYRYPDRLARSLLTAESAGRDPVATLHHAHALFGEAVRRLPCYGLPRLEFARTALGVQDTSLADEQVIAALKLAPGWRTMSAGIRGFFDQRNRTQRTRSGRDREILAAAFRIPGEAGSDVASRLLQDVLLLPKAILGALEDAEVSPRRAVSLLQRSDRWDLAEAYSARHGRRVEAVALLAYAEHLVSGRVHRTAARKAEQAREILGAEFTGWPVLALCRLAVGNNGGGLAALGEALDAGLEPAGATEILTEGGLPADRRASFWTAWIEEGDDRPVVRLELGRSLLDSGAGLDAMAGLREIAGDEEAGPEASYLIARIFLSEGNPEMALPHARRAWRGDPRNGVYTELYERLRKETE